MPSLVTERIESVKAGIIGAGAFSVTETVIVLGKFLIVAMADNYGAISTISSISISPEIIGWELLLQVAIGAVSGFLFGVTYRYVIRDDRNFHLNDGAVLAFGLVRGLALVEGFEGNLALNLAVSELLSLIFLIGQSIICFAIARSILDLAIARKVLKPFV